MAQAKFVGHKAYGDKDTYTMSFARKRIHLLDIGIEMVIQVLRNELIENFEFIHASHRAVGFFEQFRDQHVDKANQLRRQ